MRNAFAAWIAASVICMAALVAGVSQCGHRGAPRKYGFVGTGGFVPPTSSGTSGASSSAVFADSPLSGSGSAGSHLALSLSTSAELTGTGSAGSPLTTVHNGTVTSLTCGTGLSGGAVTTSGTCAVNITGGTCTNGQAVTAIGATGTATCGVASNAYAGGIVDWTDDFLGGTAPSTSFWVAALGTGSITSTADPSGVRPGIMTLNTGTSAGNHTGLSTALSGILLGGGTWEVNWVVGFSTLSNSSNGYSAMLGMADVMTAIDQVDGCYFLYDERQQAASPATGSRGAAASNILNCVCASNSVRTEYPMDGSTHDDSGSATGSTTVGALTWPSTNVLDLDLQINAAASEADFYVNGVKSCVITSHIPTAAGRQTSVVTNIQLNGAGVLSRTMDMDYFHARFVPTTPRTP